MFLEQLGADVRVRELFRPYEAAELELGRVSFAAHEQYRVYLEQGEYEAAPAGRLRWEDVLPAVGDWVAARNVGSGLALMEAVLPRRTQFSRRAAGTAHHEQVIATNVDLALVVCGLDGDFNLRRLERYLVLGHESGGETAVILNKADLCDDIAARMEAVARIAPAAQVVPLSAQQSVEPLRELVRGRTVVLLGSSGAGKSTIANGLLGDERLATRAVRASDSRGRHTTTSRMLLPLPGGGAIIDTPGMRELQLWAGEDSLDEVFSEITALAEGCRFSDCTHTGEPGCAVAEALARGDIDASRWDSFRKLGAELRHRQTAQDIPASLAERRKWKAIHKTIRSHPRYHH
jgi:ribosome biogenesis GTPase